MKQSHFWPSLLFASILASMIGTCGAYHQGLDSRGSVVDFGGQRIACVWEGDVCRVQAWVIQAPREVADAGIYTHPDCVKSDGVGCCYGGRSGADVVPCQ